MRCHNVLIIEGSTIDVTLIALGAETANVDMAMIRTNSSIFDTWGLVWDVRVDSAFITDIGGDCSVLEMKFTTRSAPPIDFYNYLMFMNELTIFSIYYNPIMDIAGMYDDGHQLYIESVSNIPKDELVIEGIYDLIVSHFDFNPETRMDYTIKDDRERAEFETECGMVLTFGYGVDDRILYDETTHSVVVVIVDGERMAQNRHLRVGDGSWVSVETGEEEPFFHASQTDENSEFYGDDSVEVGDGIFTIRNEDLVPFQEALREILDQEN